MFIKVGELCIVSSHTQGLEIEFSPIKTRQTEKNMGQKINKLVALLFPISKEHIETRPSNFRQADGQFNISLI